MFMPIILKERIHKDAQRDKTIHILFHKQTKCEMDTK